MLIHIVINLLLLLPNISQVLFRIILKILKICWFMLVNNIQVWVEIFFLSRIHFHSISNLHFFHFLHFRILKLLFFLSFFSFFLDLLMSFFLCQYWIEVVFKLILRVWLILSFFFFWREYLLSFLFLMLEILLYKIWVFLVLI